MAIKDIIELNASGAINSATISNGTIVERNESSGIFKMLGKAISRGLADGTADLVNLVSPTGTRRFFFKVTVRFTSAVSNIANESVGYAFYSTTPTSSVTAFTVVAASQIGGSTNVGTLSWSGSTLRFTTSSGGGNYHLYCIDLEGVNTDVASDTGIVFSTATAYF